MEKLSYKDRFIMEMRRNTEENTCTGYESDIRLFLNTMAKKKQLIQELDIIKSITNDDVEDWFCSVTSSDNENYALTTINRKITSLSLFFEYMRKNKALIEKNPFDGVSLYKNAEGEQKDVLTLDEVRAVIMETYNKKKGDKCFELASARIRFITSLMCTTGLRISEVLSLTFSDIEDCGEYYMINIRKDRVKNKMNKRVPICGIVKKYYEEYLCERRMWGLDSTDNDIIVLNNKGNPITRRVTETEIKKYVSRAGIDKEINNHSYRHTFRTTLTKNNVNESLVCIIGGWSRKNLAMSSIYTHDTIDLDEEKVKVCNFL